MSRYHLTLGLRTQGKLAPETNPGQKPLQGRRLLGGGRREEKLRATLASNSFSIATITWLTFFGHNKIVNGLKNDSSTLRLHTKAVHITLTPLKA
jgi:hypothetical protein